MMANHINKLYQGMEEKLLSFFSKNLVNTMLRTSIQVDKYHDRLIIYPNPSKDLVTIQTGEIGTYTVEITSLNGQKLYSRVFSANTCTVEFSSFRKGVYFITVRSKDLVQTNKIIKL